MHCEGQGLFVSRRWRRLTHSCVSTSIVYTLLCTALLYDCVFIVIAIFYNTRSLSTQPSSSCQHSNDCYLTINPGDSSFAFCPFTLQINGSLHSSAYGSRRVAWGFSIHLPSKTWAHLLRISKKVFSWTCCLTSSAWYSEDDGATVSAKEWSLTHSTTLLDITFQARGMSSERSDSCYEHHLWAAYFAITAISFWHNGISDEVTYFSIRRLNYVHKKALI